MKRVMAEFLKMPGRVSDSSLAVQEVFSSSPEKLFAE